MNRAGNKSRCQIGNRIGDLFPGTGVPVFPLIQPADRFWTFQTIETVIFPRSYCFIDSPDLLVG
jgi:hypothetical protein